MRLLTQYRMNALISDWSSEEMYASTLVAAPQVAQNVLADIQGVKEDPITLTPLLLLDTRLPSGRLLEGCEEEAGCADDDAGCTLNSGARVTSLLNPGEALVVAAHVARLLKAGVKPESIAVQSPYSAQVDLIREVMRNVPGAEYVEVASVDSFQGREAEAVIISMVRSNAKGAVGFLADARRLNVAVTRARRQVTVSSRDITLNSPLYSFDQKRLTRYLFGRCK
jgi:superfamily I DNA and/or RNA helicase